MSTIDVQGHSERAEALQAGFFAAPNQWSPVAVGANPDDERALQVSWERHKRGTADRGVLLPFRASEEGPTAWFACAESPSILRALQDELRAFLGPSFIEERPQDRSPDVADAHAVPTIARAGWHAVRFDSANPKADATVLKMWRMYEELVDRRPRRPAYVPSTFHQLRASFDRALLARDEAGALAALAALRERFGVSAENRQFLEIRLQVAFERWDLVAANPLLPQLIRLQLPPETYGDVMEALYRARVHAVEGGGDLDALLERFQEEIVEQAQVLFTTRRTSRRPAVLKAFLLYELLQEKPQTSVCERLLGELPLGAFGKSDAAVRERCGLAASSPGIEEARNSLNAEQFDRAWDLFWAASDSVDALRGLIACAREAEDPAKTAAVLARLDAADAAIRREVEEKSVTRLTKLRSGYHAPPPITALAAQFTRLPGEPEERYVQRWAEYARSADVAFVLAQRDQVGAAIDRLMELTLYEQALFERVYPAWHELFVERAEPSPQWVRLYLVMLEALKERDVFQRTDQELIHQLLVAIVESGDDESYRRAVNTVESVFENNRSPRALSWALDVCDSLAQRRVRDVDAQMRLLAQVIQACQEYASRLDSLQLQQLRLLVAEAKLPPITLPSTAPPDSSEEKGVVVTACRVAIYSLDESATRRAAEILKSLYPIWVIDTNADHVCSNKLKALAKSADVFVFAWRCSKHAAFDCVKSNSRKENLVMARGVGTSSLVKAAIEFLQS